MMDKERALEALGHIDPELIERIEVQKKRRLPRPLRAGLIAACVCLALVGTVGAVMVGFDFVGSFSQTRYTVYGELTRYPMSAFSQEFQELTAAPGISDVECRSVSELEALLGIGLYDNPVLDAADEQRSHRHILSRGADGTVEKIRMMNFYYFVPAGRSRTATWWTWYRWDSIRISTRNTGRESWKTTSTIPIGPPLTRWTGKNISRPRDCRW